VNDKAVTTPKKPKMNTSIARRHEPNQKPAKSADHTAPAGAPSAAQGGAMRGAMSSSNPRSAHTAGPVAFDQTDPQRVRLQGPTMEGASMRSSKNHAQNLVKAAPIEGVAAPDLAALGLLEDDGVEDMAVRSRPTEVIDDEPSTEFIDLEFTALDRAPEPLR
jgi:hypothetical protein